MDDDAERAYPSIGLLNVAGRCALAYSALAAAISTDFSPLSWVVIAFATWTSFACAKTWVRLGEWDKRQMFWGLASAGLLFLFIKHDPDFKVISACGANSDSSSWLQSSAGPRLCVAIVSWPMS